MNYPDFVDNDTYFKLDRSASEHDQLTAMTNNLKLVHNLTTRHYDNFDELIAAFLQAGIRIFQMQTGIVSHITEEKQYIVKDVVTPLVEILHKGDVFELEGTYCREVAKTGRTLGFPHVGEMEELKGHPVYQNLKLESYISAPIYVHGTLYGTLNFTSTQPRRFGFSEMEHDLISMLANSIGNFILLQEKEQSLLTLNNRLKEMAGYVAHDLRNPIGSIITAAEMITLFNLKGEKLEKAVDAISQSANNALELINTILNATALGTGKITLDVSPFLLTDIVTQSIANHELLAQQRQITITSAIPDGLSISGDKARLLQVFNNLLGNAVKYAQNDTAITLTGTLQENKQVLVEVSNTIASTPDRSLDDTLYQSVGFGLDIVQEILQLHGSEMVVNSDEKHYSVSFLLPLA